MGKYFGTDGFRGEANKALTAQKAFQVGRYIGWYYGKQHDDGRAKIICRSHALKAGRKGYCRHLPRVPKCCRMTVTG